MDNNGKEKRKWLHLECRMPVHYRLDSQNIFKAGLAEDISEGGIKFESDNKISKGSVLWLAMQLPLYMRPIKAKAEVIHVLENSSNNETYKVGARFLEISKKFQSIIASYIEGIVTDDISEESVLRSVLRSGPTTENGSNTTKDEIDENIDNVSADAKEETLTSVPENDYQQEIQDKEDDFDIQALIDEIESLEIIINDDDETCRLGNCAVLPFHSLKGCPPLMLGVKFRKAIMEPFLKKYGLDEDNIEKAMEKCKKKFKSLGTRYYVHTLRKGEE